MLDSIKALIKNNIPKIIMNFFV